VGVAALALFQIENLTYYYPGARRAALVDINLTIEEGEFLLITGVSGSGKSSLARVLAGLIPDFYGGRWAGRVLFRGQEIARMDRRKLAREVGIIFQDPEKQLIMTSVEAEIACGIENLGLARAEMRRRVAEVMSFLGLTALRSEFTGHLSGGQKQRVVLAAILAMHPRVLILDEPTSQLDPVAAEEFLNLVKRLNEEMGLTVVLVEQRLERCYHLAERVLLLENGRVVEDGRPEEVACRQARGEYAFVPPVARFFASLGFTPPPVTVKEGRRLLGGLIHRPVSRSAKLSPASFNTGPPVLTLKDLWFTYPNGKEALQAVSLKVRAGEFVALLGENGAGKSTLLKVMAGLLAPGRGKVLWEDSEIGSNGERVKKCRVGYLAQDPNDYLFHDTVAEELLFTLKNFALPDNGVIDELLERLYLAACREVYPRDLSSGERQRVALAAVLVTRPRLLLLDEPTRGMDYRLKAELGAFLAELIRKGRSVIVATHDIEFAAAYASRVIVLHTGRLVDDGPKERVLAASPFYAPQLAKLFYGFADHIMNLEEALAEMGPLLNPEGGAQWLKRL
jgi:energy-coupling factor transport system ATP-binding protein